MAKNWKEDKAWSDKFISSIQEACGSVFFQVASVADDQLRNTDLLCMNLGEKRIAARIRRKDYVRKYPFQFTIRSARYSGAQTELQKILAGWGDLFFYGFSNNAEDGLVSWFIGDLDVFRRNYTGQGSTRQNEDYSSDFLAFDWESMPAEFFVAFSPLTLLTNDCCHYCFSTTEIYESFDYKRICPKCCALYDYTLVIARHQQVRESVSERHLEAS